MTNTNDPNKDVHGSSTITPVAGKKGFNWLPWLLALIGLLLLLFTFRACSDRDEPADTATTTTAAVEQNTTTYPDGSASTSTLGADGQTTTSVTGPLAGTAAEAAGAAAAPLSSGLQPFLASSEPAPRRFAFDRLNFASGSATLPADAAQTVTGLSQLLTTYPNAVVRVEGYADALGSEPANVQLGAQRANAVAQALIAAGIPAARVTATSGGESNPADTNATASGQAENRRTELVVTSK